MEGVEYINGLAAARAYKLASKSDFLLGGNCYPNVEWAAEEPENGTKEVSEVKIAFVRDLPSDISEDIVKKLFEPYGKLEKIVLSKKTNAEVGFVHFFKRSDLDNAIKHLNGRSVQYAGSFFKLQVEVARPYEKNKKRAHDDFDKPSRHDTSVSKVLKRQHEVSLLSARAPKQVENMSLKNEFEEPIVIDPYEATVISLPDPIKDRLLRILRLVIATRYDIDLRLLRDLKELPEPISISILDQFMLSATDVVDKGAFLAALIAKHVKILGLNSVKLPAPRYLSRAEPVGDVGSDLPRIYGRSHAAYESSARVTTNQARYNNYTSVRSHSPPELRYSISHQPGIPKVDTTILSLREPTLSLRSYRKAGTEYPLGASSSKPVRHQIRMDYAPKLPITDYSRSPQASILKADKPTLCPHLPPVTLPSYVGTDSPPVASRDQPTRQQVRFDPFTGEPYKFDPFTGEPILPESTHRHN
ncbi:Heterogeneous nuclear ribonucleoprotein R-like protein [Drosera capensis]